MQIKKIIWKFEGIPIRKADDTRESKYITNQWNNHIKRGEGQGADLSHSGNEQRLRLKAKGTAQQACTVVDKVVSCGVWLNL